LNGPEMGRRRWKVGLFSNCSDFGAAVLGAVSCLGD
jgi:hypothetical protein